MEEDFATVGFVTFLFGIFCAYWAQETSRSAWLWFFLGLFLGPIAGIVLLGKNNEDRQAKRTA
jgi:formate hydrogenlyase subunit 3/multisubunit Na+/H+ antiporter MnhD subunit